MRQLFVTLLLATTFVLTGCETVTRNIYQPTSTWDLMRSDFRLTQQSNEEIDKQVAHLTNRTDIFQDAVKNAPPYLYHIVQRCIEKDLPSELALIPMIESGYNPFAHSKAGASGLWQMMPSTASGMKLNINWWLDERRDFVKATDAALDHLKYLHQKLGSWDYAIAAYDAGEGRISRMLAEAPAGSTIWDLPLPTETRRYLVKIHAAKKIITHAESYDISLPTIPAKPFFKAITTKKHMDIDAIATDLHYDHKTFRELNASHRRLSTPSHQSTTFYIPTTHYHKASVLLSDNNKTNHLIYTVKEADTLLSIAKKFDSSVSLIAKMNQITNNYIKKGQKLIVNRKSNRSAEDHKIITADQAPGPQQHTYTVQKNDTLSNIAQKYQVTQAAIIYWNHLKTRKIMPNDKLIIWTKPLFKGNYTVKSGDNLFKLAMAYGTTVDKIKTQNNLQSNQIRIGQKLHISSGDLT